MVLHNEKRNSRDEGDKTKVSHKYLIRLDELVIVRESDGNTICDDDETGAGNIDKVVELPRMSASITKSEECKREGRNHIPWSAHMRLDRRSRWDCCTCELLRFMWWRGPEKNTYELLASWFPQLPPSPTASTWAGRGRSWERGHRRNNWQCWRLLKCQHSGPLVILAHQADGMDEEQRLESTYTEIADDIDCIRSLPLTRFAEGAHRELANI